MLKNSLTDIAAIIFLRDDKLLYRLIFEEFDVKNLNIRDLIGEFEPNSFRKPAIDYAIEYIHNLNPEKIDLNYSFDFLEKVFKKFFEFDGSFIVVKDRELEEYNAFINKVHPYNVVGYYLAKRLVSGEISEYTILEFAENITPLCFKKPRDEKDYADNHIHMGGSVNDFASLVQFFNKKNIKKLNLPRLNHLSFINSKKLEFENLLRVLLLAVKNIVYEIKGVSLDKLSFEEVYKSEFYNKIFSFDEFVRVYDIIGGVGNNILLNKMIEYYKEGKYNKFGFLFNVLMFRKYLENQDEYFDKSVKIFLHITNILRSYILMSQNIGLTSFSEFNRSSFKKNFNNLSDIADTIFSSGTTKCEVKFSPSKSNRGLKLKITTLKKAFDKEVLKNNIEFIETKSEKRYLNSNKSKIKYHFCIHFIREKSKKSERIRYYSLRKKLKKQAEAIDELLKNQRIISKKDFYKNFDFEFEEELKTQYLDLSKLITTIDVAGDENRTPPEVFAPAIKFLRRDLKKLDEFKFRIVEGLKGKNFLENHRLRLSVHAGEDFNHIVSGMRKIDETIEFYKMREYDRIGHALAIGIDPKMWAYRNRNIVLTKQEDLDNLVWMYFKAIKISDYLPSANRLKEEFLGEIKKLSKEIYDEDYDVYDLYEAWKLREYCPIYFNDAGISEYIKVARFSGNREKLKKAIEIYEKYNNDKEAIQKGEEVVELREYNLFENEFEFYEALQDYMIEKLARRKIFIETNPTSNVYIGFFEKYEEHPIFRWNPLHYEDLLKGGKYNKFGIRNTRAKVCVNTDDPMIMPTTIYNEFVALENAARKHTKNEDTIRKWIHSIRKQGLEIFDNTHKHYEYIGN
jgi:adenosine deaminase